MIIYNYHPVVFYQVETFTTKHGFDMIESRVDIDHISQRFTWINVWGEWVYCPATIDQIKNSLQPDFKPGEMVRVLYYRQIQEWVTRGRGIYPYDCNRKDQFPDATIFHCPSRHCWVGDYDLVYLGNDVFLYYGLFDQAHNQNFIFHNPSPELRKIIGKRRSQNKQ